MKNFLFKLLSVAVVGMTFTEAQAQLTVKVFNHTSYTNPDFIYLLPSDTASGTNYNITYGGTNALPVFQSTPLSALPQTTNGAYEFQISYSQSLAMYVSLNNSANPWINTNGSQSTPSYTAGPPITNNPSANQWAQVPFGFFEASYTNGIQDNADTTAINSVGIPMLMQMVNTNNNAVISKTGYTNAAAIPALNAKLATIPGSAWLGAAPNTNIIRYIGPNQVVSGGVAPPSGGAIGTNAANPQIAFPAFTDYIDYVETRTNATKIAGQVSIVNGANTTNWQYNYAFDMFVTNGAVNLTNGVITATNTIASTNTSFYTTNGLSAFIIADVDTSTNAFLSSYIYSAPASFGGATATNQSAYTNSPVGEGKITYTGGWEGLAADTDQDFFTAFAPKVMDHILGDVSFGFAAGFINSQATNDLGVKIGDLTSSEWFNQPIIFDEAQTNSTFYSQYANAIFDATTAVYAHPYGDRMSSIYPNSIALTNADSSLEIHLYDPATIPEPVAALLVTLGIVVFAGFKTWQDSRRKKLT